MFPHLMHDAATHKMDALKNFISSNDVLETYKLLVQSSNSISMVESCTSDEDVCTAAPEIHMNGMSPVSPVVTSLVDRTRSASGAALEDWNLRVPLSPCQVTADGLVHKMRQLREEQTAFQDSYGCCVGVSPWSSSDPAPVTVLAKSNCESGSGGTDMDDSDVRAILFCHASQPVTSVEEMASSRPQRRNVRISKHPQSVAARHRRERIGDRMRVLQRLVPGGTKMDTASMLDKAIHYVKFLQLQVQTLEQIGSNSGNNCDSAQVAGNSGTALQ